MSYYKRPTERETSSGKPEYEWWLNGSHDGRRFRMAADDFAAPRMQEGKIRPIRGKEELKYWHAIFVQEVKAGKDPRVPPGKAPDTPSRISDLIALYIKLYVDTAPLKSRRTHRSELRRIEASLGSLPVAALELPTAAEELRRSVKGLAVASQNHYMTRLRALSYWAYQRQIIGRTPFGPGGAIKISRKHEVIRSRRVLPEEEARLFAACAKLDAPNVPNRRLSWEHVRDIRQRVADGESQQALCAAHGISSGLCSQIVTNQIWREDRVSEWTSGDQMRLRLLAGLELGCRMGEMLKIQNRDIEWEGNGILLRAENTKSGQARHVYFQRGGPLHEILKRRRPLGDEKYPFGDEAGGYVRDFGHVFERLKLWANGQEPTCTARHQRLTLECRAVLKAVNLEWRDLRRECATRWLERGVNVRVIQRLLGHSDISTTMRYLNVQDTSIVAELEQALWEPAEAGASVTPSSPPPGFHGAGSSTVAISLGNMEPAVGLEPTTC